VRIEPDRVDAAAEGYGGSAAAQDEEIVARAGIDGGYARIVDAVVAVAGLNRDRDIRPRKLGPPVIDVVIADAAVDHRAGVNAPHEGDDVVAAAADDGAVELVGINERRADIEGEGGEIGG